MTLKKSKTVRTAKARAKKQADEIVIRDVQKASGEVGGPVGKAITKSRVAMDKMAKDDKPFEYFVEKYGKKKARPSYAKYMWLQGYDKDEAKKISHEAEKEYKKKSKRQPAGTHPSTIKPVKPGKKTTSPGKPSVPKLTKKERERQTDFIQSSIDGVVLEQMKRDTGMKDIGKPTYSRLPVGVGTRADADIVGMGKQPKHGGKYVERVVPPKLSEDKEFMDKLGKQLEKIKKDDAKRKRIYDPAKFVKIDASVMGKTDVEKLMKKQRISNPVIWKEFHDKGKVPKHIWDPIERGVKKQRSLAYTGKSDEAKKKLEERRKKAEAGMIKGKKGEVDYEKLQKRVDLQRDAQTKGQRIERESKELAKLRKEREKMLERNIAEIKQRSNQRLKDMADAADLYIDKQKALRYLASSGVKMTKPKRPEEGFTPYAIKRGITDKYKIKGQQTRKIDLKVDKARGKIDMTLWANLDDSRNNEIRNVEGSRDYFNHIVSLMNYVPVSEITQPFPPRVKSNWMRVDYTVYAKKYNPRDPREVE